MKIKGISIRLPGRSNLMVWPVVFGIFLSTASSGAERPVGSIYYQCSSQVKFMVPGPNGQPPVFKNPLRPKRPVQPWIPGPLGPELIEANGTVESDGRITSLRMDWLQSGLLGWPQHGRADLDDIALHVTFDSGKESHQKFDPALLSVKISALETKKIRRPRLLTIQKSLGNSDAIGGLADVPAWLHSASIVLPWVGLRQFAQSNAKLNFSIEEIVFRDKQFYHDHIRGGELDLSMMEEVIERFKEVEAQLKVKAENRDTQCRKITVEPEIYDSALSEL